MTLAENTTLLRAAAEALDLDAIESALNGREVLLAAEGVSEADMRDAIAASEEAADALRMLRRCFALEASHLRHVERGFGGGAPGGEQLNVVG